MSSILGFILSVYYGNYLFYMVGITLSYFYLYIFYPRDLELIYIPILQIVFLIIAVRLSSREGIGLRDLIAHKREELKFNVLLTILLTVGITLSLYFILYPLYGMSFRATFSISYSQPSLWFVIAPTIAIIAGIAEEIIWRGYGVTMVEKLTKTRKALKAILLTSLAFAVWHVWLFHIPLTFVIGIIYSYIYVKRRTLVPLIAAHAAVDIITFLIP